jgi:hypothetical protein
MSVAKRMKKTQLNWSGENKKGKKETEMGTQLLMAAVESGDLDGYVSDFAFHLRGTISNIREHEIADVTKKTRIYTILSEIFTLCLCF